MFCAAAVGKDSCAVSIPKCCIIKQYTSFNSIVLLSYIYVYTYTVKFTSACESKNIKNYKKKYRKPLIHIGVKYILQPLSHESNLASLPCSILLRSFLQKCISYKRTTFFVVTKVPCKILTNNATFCRQNLPQAEVLPKDFRGITV